MADPTLAEQLADVQRRLGRMEARICQLMLHFGVTPKGIVSAETASKNPSNNPPADRDRA